MAESLLSHFLIGAPGSGKSTFAALLHRAFPTTVIISTDAIRAQLFGDETIQGEWSLIEETVLRQMRSCFRAGCPVIYDATNVRREWRKALLAQVQDEPVRWLGWHLQAPVELCKTWNAKRLRRVPEDAIAQYCQLLAAEPPEVSEGFVGVNRVVVTPEGFETSTSLSLKNSGKSNIGWRHCGEGINELCDRLFPMPHAPCPNTIFSHPEKS